jgi:hypothetical protein
MKRLELGSVVAYLLGVHHEDRQVLLVESRIDRVCALHGAQKERGRDQRNE